MNIIKTAVITIVISIISGLLLDYIKNVAPRILCSIGKGVRVKKDNKIIYKYNVTIRNMSKKIIHELNLSMQSSQGNLEIKNARITRGLKFESSVKGSSLDVSIPYLSKGDKFSVTVYSESRNKPVIVMRSPENFKRVDSGSSSVSSSSTGNDYIGNIRNAVILVACVLLVVVLFEFYFKMPSFNIKNPMAQTNVQKSPAKDTSVKSSNKGSAGNTNTKSQQTDTTKQSSDTKPSTDTTKQNTDTQKPVDQTKQSNPQNDTQNSGKNPNTDTSNKNVTTTPTTPTSGTSTSSPSAPGAGGTNTTPGK